MIRQSVSGLAKRSCAFCNNLERDRTQNRMLFLLIVLWTALRHRSTFLRWSVQIDIEFVSMSRIGQREFERCAVRIGSGWKPFKIKGETA